MTNICNGEAEGLEGKSVFFNLGHVYGSGTQKLLLTSFVFASMFRSELVSVSINYLSIR